MKIITHKIIYWQQKLLHTKQKILEIHLQTPPKQNRERLPTD